MPEQPVDVAALVREQGELAAQLENERLAVCGDGWRGRLQHLVDRDGGLRSYPAPAATLAVWRELQARLDAIGGQLRQIRDEEDRRTGRKRPPLVTARLF